MINLWHMVSYIHNTGYHDYSRSTQSINLRNCTVCSPVPYVFNFPPTTPSCSSLGYCQQCYTLVASNLVPWRFVYLRDRYSTAAPRGLINYFSMQEIIVTTSSCYCSAHTIYFCAVSNSNRGQCSLPRGRSKQDAYISSKSVFGIFTCTQSGKISTMLSGTVVTMGICCINSRGQPISDGPSTCGMGETLKPLHNRINVLRNVTQNLRV